MSVNSGKKNRDRESNGGSGNDPSGGDEGNHSIRLEAHESAKSELQEIIPELPKKFGNITVFDFGKLNTEKAFHTPVKLYPVGFKCEIELDGNIMSPRGRGSSKNTTTILQCEIVGIDDQPEFLITVQSSNRVFISSTESGVWRKFEGDNHLNCELSFYNLKIELLLEGLDNALDCGLYMFHCERGYGDSYTNDEQAMLANSVFMSRESRASRSRHRSHARNLTAEESKVISDAKKKQQKLDAEVKRRLAEEEKQKKEKEKAQREKEKEIERKRKEQEKALREKEKELARRSREAQRKEDRAKNHMRKDVMGDLRKARAEALVHVLQGFDAEEDEEELRLAAVTSVSEIDASSSTGAHLDDVLSSLPTFSTRLGIENPRDTEKVMDVVNILYSLKPLLKIGDDLSFEYFVRDILGTVLPVTSGEGGNDEAGEAAGKESDDMEREEGNSGDAEIAPEDPAQEDAETSETTEGAVAAAIEGGGSMDEEEESGEGVDTNDLVVATDAGQEGGEYFKAKGKRGRPRRSCSGSNGHEESPAPQQSAVDADRIQLNMIRVMLGDLQDLFGLNEDAEGGAKKKGKEGKKHSVNFPLNQLTWQELARMLIILELNSDSEISDEELMCAIRGSKQSTYKHSKNIIRYIRYRMAVRFFTKKTSEYAMKDLETAGEFTGPFAEKQSGDIEDFLLRYALPPSHVQLSAEEKSQNLEDDSQLFDFTSENEVIGAIAEVVENTEEYSEEYRRCCKVWLRVASMSQAKNLMWEVDPTIYPDYSSVIKNPNSFSRIACRLIKRSYGEDYTTGQIVTSETVKQDTDQMEESGSDNAAATAVGDSTTSSAAGDMLPTTEVVVAVKQNEVAEEVPHKIGAVAASFYRDMRQVILNCFVYNTEAINVVAQAQKVLQVLHRHMSQWIFNPSPPPVEACDDMHCLYSFDPIPLSSVEYNSVKCGRCTGVFAIDTLNSHRKEVGFVLPSQEHFQQSEDWLCPLCLLEDSVMTEGHDGRERVEFSIDEWGPSTLLPWQYNQRHSALVTNEAKNDPRIHYMVEALKVLSSPNITAVIQGEQRHLTRSSWAEQIQTPWSIEDRLNVYAALCEVLKCHDESNSYLNGIYNECVKLSKMSIREPFHEADFIDQVQKVAGKDGAALCMRMMDGMDYESAQERLKLQVIDGRCLVCRGSTFEDDYEGTVLLCDGCNGEAHFPCLELEKIPTKEWFCESCSERMSNRYEDKNSLEAQFKDVDLYRSKDIELQLIDELAERRDDEDASDAGSDILCAYCGQNELDICSPMVYGQSRAEYNAYVAMSETPTADGIFPNKKDTALKFCVLMDEVKPPEPCMPYFPLVNDPMASRLKAKKTSSIHSPIVHELCALSMFKARMQRNKHAIRRRRRIVADRIASLSGMSIQPLGYDDKGRSYWQFPTSTGLFISPPHSTGDLEPDREALLNMLKSNGKSKKASSMSATPIEDDTSLGTGDDMKVKDWIAVDDLEVISQVIEMLGRSSGELSLRKVLTAYYAEDIEKHRREKAEAARKEQAIDDAGGEAEEKQGEGEGEDGSSTMEEDGDNAPEQAEEEANDADGAEGDDKKEEDVDDDDADQDFSGMEGRVSLPRKAAPVFNKAGEGKAVKMSIMPEKGVEVQSRYVIKQEKVFEDGDNDDSGEEDDDEEEDVAFQEYFQFSRSSKYFAIALLDCYDKVVKLGKNSGVSVVFEIKRDGIAQGLAYTPLDEPWTDGMYYFSTLNFRRSGKYTISFLVEGVKMSHIKPLVYPLVVEAEHVSCGPSCALTRLRAADYITHADRQIISKRRELLTEISRSENEFVAVKALLLSVYLALPVGALMMGPEEEDKRNDIFGHIAEATGWNSNIDQSWRGCVLEASSPAMLMECLLLLEYYISKAWLVAPASKLLAALPNHHFAVRCVTNSAVALRIFCLDKCLAYDRIQNVPRGVRVTGDSSRATTITGGSSVSVAPPRKSRNSMQAKRTLEMSRGNYFEEEVPVSTYSERPKRGASLRAREALTASVKAQYQEDSEDERRTSSRRRGMRERPPAGPEWPCHICTALNEFNARKCQICGTTKSETANSSSTRMSRAERLQQRQKAYMSESSDDGGNSGSSDDDSENKHTSRRNKREVDREADLGLRKRPRVSYAEDDDRVDEYETSSKKKQSKAAVVEPQEEEEEEEEDIDIEAIIASRKEELSEDQFASDITLNLLEILRTLGDEPNCDPFWYPVDLREYPDYSVKIEEPMDLSTIAKRVEVSFYGDDHEDFARHVRLVVKNCKTYNSDGSEISAMADRLGELFDEQYQAFLQSQSASRTIADVGAASEALQQKEEAGDVDNGNSRSESIESAAAIDEEDLDDGYEDEVIVDVPTPVLSGRERSLPVDTSSVIERSPMTESVVVDGNVSSQSAPVEETQSVEESTTNATTTVVVDDSGMEVVDEN